MPAIDVTWRVTASNAPARQEFRLVRSPEYRAAIWMLKERFGDRAIRADGHLPFRIQPMPTTIAVLAETKSIVGEFGARDVRSYSKAMRILSAMFDRITCEGWAVIQWDAGTSPYVVLNIASPSQCLAYAGIK